MKIARKLLTAWRVATSGAKGWKSFLWNTSLSQLNMVGPLMPPVYIAIEPTNACNAKCPVCETGKNEMTRRSGMLDRQAYEKFVDQIAPYTNSLLFYFMGEPFLNKHAYDMIRYTREKGIFVETCTNGDYVDAKGVIYSDINKISFQLGGMTEESHSRYRVSSSLAAAKKNLYELIEERKKHPESNVQIEVGLIVMRHNEHEVDEFQNWAKEIGADTVNIIDPCVRNMLEGFAYLPRDKKYWYYDSDAFEKGTLKPKHIPDNECVWIWNSMQINWNGDVVPCCRDPLGKHILGNIFEESIMDVFNGEKAREFRRRVLSDQANIDICQLCSGYGPPDMIRENPMSFEIKRHSFNAEDVELPNESL